MAKGKWQRNFIISGTHTTTEALLNLVAVRPELGWRHAGTVDSKDLDGENVRNVQDIICGYAPSSKSIQQYSDTPWNTAWDSDFYPKWAQIMPVNSSSSLEGIPLFSG